MADRINAEQLTRELVDEGLTEEQATVAVAVMSGKQVQYSPGSSGGRRTLLEATQALLNRYPHRTSTFEADGTETHVWKTTP